ncbi:gliding motility-associated C-terminal domain-containing protein [Lentimicrobium sp.]|jgi:gliding motility-associated-like protein|uniref:T9SS type B sorting domain-containing protein n=2 Tax=Lentimicrobium sp. TaxID=2034841 RepID=UPI002CB0865B|nr:gliding motility-associated C-terminal domain-containing protein [Lentimicrobium sp.]MCO5264107.1 gliding motility-associated C-terminal domain-containing protein [Lentimicrobium sp.]HPJ63246.1 gliding motility-associated C-terminal domain-containing protein [Lentimicrobium sp.]HPR27129.1 gliding motility-associated C-terminal domain-containing protein [Lentimicrobium sp.]
MSLLFVVIYRYNAVAQVIPTSSLSAVDRNLTPYGLIDAGTSCYLYGIIGSEGSGGKVMVVKFTMLGDVIWQKSYAGTDNVLIRSACLNVEGGLTLAGNTTSGGDGNDVVVLKIDDRGNLIWSQVYGQNNDERGFRIIMLADESYIVCGSTQRQVTLLEDGFIMRISASGQLLWHRIIGGGDRDNVFDVSLDNDNNLIFTGPQSSYGAGVFDFGFGKMDLNGNLLYYKTVGSYGQDHSRIIRQADDGYFILGHTSSYSGAYYEIFLLKIDFSGSVLWARRFFTGNELYTGDLTILPDGLMISGSTLNSGKRNLFVIRTGFDGIPMWGKVFGMSYFQEFPFGGSGVIMPDKTDAFSAVGLVQRGTFSEALLIALTSQPNPDCFEQDFIPQSENIDLTSVDWTSSVQVSGSFNQKNISFLTSEIQLEKELLCAPGVTADFNPDKVVVCVGDTVRFTDLSYDQPLQYFWTFEGGSPETSVTKNPVVVYHNPGEFDVRLSVENAHGIDELLRISLIRVVEAPPVSLGNDTVLCEFSDLDLFVPGFDTYLWHDGSTENRPSAVTAGWNFVSAYTLEGCMARDSIFVALVELPDISLGPDTSFCDVDAILLTAPGFDAYQWHDGSTGNYLLTSMPGWNYVNAYTSEGCVVSDSIFIRYCCNFSLNLPNAFTPDNDGINDYFKPIISVVPNYSMVIANRWGAVLFSTNNLHESWDGTFKGKKCPQGVYYVCVQFDGCNDLGQYTPEIVYRSVTLLRKL